MVLDGIVPTAGTRWPANSSLMTVKEKVYITKRRGNTKGEESLEEETTIRLEGYETID